MTMKDYYLTEFAHDIARCFHGAHWDTEDGQAHIPPRMILARMQQNVLKHPAECMWCLTLHRIVNLLKCESPELSVPSERTGITDRLMVVEFIDHLMPRTVFDLSSGGHVLACWISALLRVEGQCGGDIDRLATEAAELLREIHSALIPGQSIDDLVVHVQNLVDAIDGQRAAAGLAPSIRRLERLRDELRSLDNATMNRS
jgi:hypothetical protein